MGATPYWDEENSEWYLALSENGKVAYTGKGDMVKFYGDGSPFNTNINTTKKLSLMGIATATSLSTSLKTGLIEESASGYLKGKGISYKSGGQAVDKAFGKNIGTYCRIFKAGAIILDGWYIYDQVDTNYELYENNNLSEWHLYRSSLNIGMTLLGYQFPYGYAGSLLYFIIDSACGDEIWRQISNDEIIIQDK